MYFNLIGLRSLQYRINHFIYELPLDGGIYLQFKSYRFYNTDRNFVKNISVVHFDENSEKLSNKDDLGDNDI